jgi:RNA polymerase sigma-70 factor (ECF subfamily)
LKQHLRRELDTLQPKYRELVVLRDLEGLSYGEIAEITGIETKRVKSRLFQARQLLFEKMQKYVEESSHV